MSEESGQQPYEGIEGTPPGPVPPPQRYQPEAPLPGQDVFAPRTDSPVPATSGAVTKSEPTAVDRFANISGPLGFVLFMVCGFALDGWAWSWLFFMLPALAHGWRNAGKDD